MAAQAEEDLGADLEDPEPDRCARADPDGLGDDLTTAALEQNHAADLLARRADPVEIVEPEA